MGSPFLTSKRMRYAWFGAGALWLTWAFSLLLGGGDRDLAGHPIAPDFLQFYVAGTMVRSGESAALYNVTALNTARDAIIGNWPTVTLYVAPPVYAWVFVPLSVLPYMTAAIFWMTINLGCFWLSMRMLVSVQHLRAFGWALTFMPTFAAIGGGQTSAISLLLLCLVYNLWQRERLWAAGVICSVLLYKPQLILGVGLLWLLDSRRDWRALCGFMLGGSVLGGLSLALAHEATLAYLSLPGKLLAEFILLKGFPLWRLFSTRGFWLMLLPEHPNWADGLYLTSAGIATLRFLVYWRRQRSDRAMAFAGAICYTLMVTPYVMDYDWAILLLPASLLWQNRNHNWRDLFALVWFVAFVSSMLTMAQLRVLPIAVQVSVPVLAFALTRISARLHRQPAFQAMLK